MQKFNIAFLYRRKAEQNIPENMATGPDGMPVELTNKLGPAGKAHLYNVIKRATKTKRIPT